MRKEMTGKFYSRPFTAFTGRTVTIRTVAVYVAAFAAMVLAASVDKLGLALCIGLFSGFAYARMNLLALAPMLIVACIIFSPDWWTLLYTVTPVVLFIVLYGVFFKLKKNVEVYFVALTALLSMVPYAVVSALRMGAVAEIAVFLVVGLVFSFCSAIVAYAVIFRKISARFTLEEQICAGIMLAVAAYATAGAGGDGFYMYFIAAGFLVLLSSDCFAPSATLMCAVLLGAGAALGFDSLTLLGAAAVWGGLAVALSPFTRFASACGIIAAEAVMWLTGAHVAAGWQSLILLIGGCVIYLCVPARGREIFKRVSLRKNKNAVNSIVNRNRGELAGKLYAVSDVFYDMSKDLDTAADVEGTFTPQRLAREVAKNYCGKCADRESCFAQLGGDTSSVIEGMASAALNRGKVTILDMPPFITGRCSKLHNLASVMNGAAESYAKRKKEAQELNLCKRMMSEQFAGVSLVMDSMARECAEQVSFSEDINEIISTELLKHNIVASEVVVLGEGTGVKAAVTVRECDSDKAVLAKIVSAKLKTPLVVQDVRKRGEMRVVHLESAPVFEIAYGVAERKKENEEVSGDSRSILCPSSSRRLFAISDGMGNGDAAAEASRQAIRMVENFYRAGIDNGIILSLANKLLKLRDTECFSSLDISVIDTSSGSMDIIKMGAADSFIVRRDSIETVSSCTPPAGILDGVNPVTNRVQLYDGDIVLMMSDGVYDALDVLGVSEVVDEQGAVNPQKLADALLARALDKGASDDCTVLALRIFCL